MKAINKGPEPVSLTRHRLSENCDYDNYREKSDLRRALVTEQRGLCCYCMDRIHDRPKGMKIEHWQCQAQYPAEQLKYRNLLGACLGGQGLPSELQHCDTKKGDSPLQWNPANLEHRIEARVRYEPDGSVRSDDTVFDEQLNNILNLNLQLLKNSRKRVYDAVVEWWSWEKSRLRGPVPRERLVRERDRYVAGTSELAPFRQVAVWLLGQKLARMAE
jgi:uncharacterized protein (TIGR02646 family)